MDWLMRNLLAMLSVLWMAGCTEGSSVYHYDYGRYSGSTATYAARNGEMQVVVAGNPTTADHAVFAAAAARALDGVHPDPGVRFVVASSAAATGYRIVLAFGGSTQSEICSDHPLASRSVGAGPMAAAFCLDKEALSFTAGHMAAVKDPGDPALRNHLQAVGAALLPDQNPNYSRDCQGAGPRC